MYKLDDRDRENLKFLLESDAETLWRWYQTCSPDDLLYAQNLIYAAQLQYQTARQLMTEPDVSSVSQASALLSKYTLNPSRS